MELPGGEAVLATDTVGFVRKLPHQLVEAFRSTLDVAADADLLVHVVDCSAPDPELQMAAVREVLAKIGAAEVPELLCFNKRDRSEEWKRLVDRHPGSVAVSATTGEGIDDLLAAMAERLRSMSSTFELLVPFARGDVLAEIHREGEVLSEAAGEDGMAVTARLDPAGAARLAPFVIDAPGS
jgi:GTP-binding protein HflX